MAVALSLSTGPDVILLDIFSPFIMLRVTLCSQMVKQGQIYMVSWIGPQKDHFEKNLDALILCLPQKLM